MRTAVGVAALGGVIVAMAWQGKREWGWVRARRARQEVHAWLMVTGAGPELQALLDDLGQAMEEYRRAVAIEIRHLQWYGRFRMSERER